ncbi:MAG TPA: S46 family peptidase [Bacteroidales bacterium]|nr:S46 family peptidase [Bacteroidales bacterium]HRR48515.1 S46 family peptidase [Bacteroidales bacterium]HRT33010.1 S46 family peptidase [Bacteroidales bacterium]HRT83020.1 S46 family peptidase [Bacteroidales bacterium]
MKNNIITRFLVILFLLSVSGISRADEGMWLVNLLDKNLTQQMKKTGLKLDPKLIYDESGSAVSNAVVALDFGCTGSIISDKGLLITNHHCAYSDIHALSTPEKNYLEDGYWAMNISQEIPIKGKSVFFLRKVTDVTDEIKQISDSLKKNNIPGGMRKITNIIETKHSKQSGMETSCNSMWRGSKYYMFYYEVYTDIRFVGAPPVSVAAFGGETDNWEWPQHKGDFALYRVYGNRDGKPAPYSVDNVPISPKKVLPISTKGIKDGDFTMILGFPGRTNRYSSSFSIHEKEKVTNPISVKIMREKLDILNKWMKSDPNIRLKYADYYFGISNLQEMLEGEVMNFRRFGVEKIFQEREKELQQWIDSDSQRQAKWGGLLQKLSTRYNGTEEITRIKKYYQNTLVGGYGLIAIANKAGSLNNSSNRDNLDTLKVGQREYVNFIKEIEKIYKECDMRAEHEMLKYTLKTFVDNVPPLYRGDYINGLAKQFNNDGEAMADYIFNNSIFTNPEKFRQIVKNDQPVSVFGEDPLNLMSKSIGVRPFNEAISKICKGESIDQLEAEYGRVVYQMNLDKGRNQYPDANSTMRLTYGTVGPLDPSDGIHCKSQTTTQGLWDKYNPDNYDFNIKPRMLGFLENKDWGNYCEKGKMFINFLTDNDITGGNSGSPVMNSNGEIIGLAFDGNKESLASDAYFHPQMNKCVNVDIRYVLWIIDKYAGAGYLIDEMHIIK